MTSTEVLLAWSNAISSTESALGHLKNSDQKDPIQILLVLNKDSKVLNTISKQPSKV